MDVEVVTSPAQTSPVAYQQGYTYDSEIVIKEHAEIHALPVDSDDYFDNDNNESPEEHGKQLPIKESWNIHPLEGLQNLAHAVMRPLRALKHKAVDEPLAMVKETVQETGHKMHDTVVGTQQFIEDEIKRGLQAGDELVHRGVHKVEHAVDTGKLIVDDLAHRVSDSATQAKDAIKHSVDETVRAVQDLPGTVKSGVKREINHLEANVDHIRQAAEDKAREALDIGRNALKGVVHKVEDKREETSDKLGDFVDKLRHPSKLFGGDNSVVVVPINDNDKNGQKFQTGTPYPDSMVDKETLQDDIRQLIAHLKRTSEDLDQVKESAQRVLWDGDLNSARQKGSSSKQQQKPFTSRDRDAKQVEDIVRQVLQGHTASEKANTIRRSQLSNNQNKHRPPYTSTMPLSKTNSLLSSMFPELPYSASPFALSSVLPVTALFSLLMGVYYIYISRKLYKARTRTNIWIGDGQFQLYKLLQEQPNGNASAHPITGKSQVAKHALFSLLQGVQLRDGLMTALPIVMLYGIIELMGAAPAFLYVMYAILLAGQFLLLTGTHEEIQQLETNFDLAQDEGGPLLSHESASRKTANTIYYGLYLAGFAWMGVNLFL